MKNTRKEPVCFHHRFGWFWYNDEEIFFNTQEQIDAKMKRMKDQGITHVITFSCTHFRWSFKPWWSTINECLRKICNSAHQYGIKVIEHHSSHLTSFPDGPEHTDGFQREFLLRHGDVNHYPGLMEFMLHPAPEEPERWQICGDTGLPAFPYDAHTHCFNNPDYLRDYLNYLETVYETGVDGIMTDDVQYYGLGMTCACKVCREKFFKETGFRLPENGNREAWKNWFSDLRNPGVGTWIKFKKDSILNFHRKVAEHYHSLGYEMIRPNYTSGALRSNLSGYTIDNLPELDIVFQECCYSSVIRYSFLSYLDEQQHRAMLGRQRNIPHMMMFYADDEQKLTFVFGVARLAGAMLTNTPEGGNAPDETKIRRFEAQYGDKLFGLTPYAPVGFLDSRDNCAFGPCMDMSRQRVWMNSCRLSNIQHILVSIDNPSSWNVQVLILNEVGLMTDLQMKNLEKWMEKGGTLIVTGQNGVMNEKFAQRPDAARADFETADLKPSEIRIEKRGLGSLIKAGYGFGYPGTDEEKRTLFIDNQTRFDPRAIMKHIGNLKHISDSFDDRNSPSSSRPGKMMRDMASSRQEVTKLLKSLLSKEELTVSGIPEGVFYTAYRTAGNGRVFHFLNGVGCLDAAPDAVPSHRDPIPFPEIEGTMELSFADPEGKVRSLRLASLDGEESLPVRTENGQTICRIELKKLKNYILLFTE